MHLLKLGEVVVDRAAQRLLRGAVEVHLQPLPWQLLERLLDRPDHLFSREELEQALWPGVFVTADSLTQVIRRLRAAFGDDGVIDTVPRRGYRLGLAPEPVGAARPAILRHPPDRFVGRDAERAAIDAALAGARLVTLVGPGGVGKTRLAAQWAGSTAEWVDLGAVADVDDAARAVGDALGVGGADPAAAVGAALAQRGATRLVLDELEHLAVGPLIAGWLSAAPELRVVATSRSVLGVRGERVVRVDPLSPSDGIELLRARSEHPVADADAAAIVGAVDALPLAIELAATRLRAVPAAVLAARLADPGLLAAPPVDRPARHASLDAALADSWGALDPADRADLVRLAVFVGPLPWPAVEAALGAGALDRVQRLVDRSWLRVLPSGRLVVLAILRAHVLSRAAPDGVRDAEQRHGAWFASYGTRAALGEIERERAGRYREVADALEDVIVACERAIDRGDGDVAAATAFAAVAVLQRRGPLARAIGLLRRVDALPAVDRRGSVLGSLGQLLRRVGEREEALQVHERQVAWARAQGHRGYEGIATVSLAMALRAFGHRRAARHHLRAALPILEEVGDVYHQGVVRSTLGALAAEVGELDDALAETTLALELYRREGIGKGEAQCRSVRASHLTALGRYDEALADLELALRAEEARDDVGRQVIVHHRIGVVHARRGALAEARRHLERAVTLGFEVGETDGLGTTLAALASVLARSGALDEARAALDRARDATGREEDSIRVELGHAGVSRLAGRPDLDRVEQALARAERYDHAPLLAEARLERLESRCAAGLPVDEDLAALAVLARADVYVAERAAAVARRR